MSSRSAASVAVIVPLHDNAATIAETLDSVLAQTVNHDRRVDCAVIVVDDGSRDDGARIAATHAARPRIVVSPRARGVSAARNAGLAAADESGADFVVFLDADDVLLPRAIAERLAYAERHAGAVIVSRCDLWFPDGHTAPAESLRAGADPRVQLLRENGAPIHAHFVPRACLSRVSAGGDGPFLEGLARLEDWDLWLRLALAGTRFVSRDVVDCRYRQRADAAAMTMRALDAADDAERVLLRARPLVDALPAFERGRFLRLWKRSLQHYRFWGARSKARERDVTGAILAAAAAVAASPRDAPLLPLRTALAAAERALRKRRRRGVRGWS